MKKPITRESVTQTDGFPRRRLIGILAAASLASWTVPAATAADYPEGPISVMVSYDAGGATDFQARIVTATAGDADVLDEPMVIINKPGAGGRVGWNWLVNEAEPDGYTLGVYNVPHFIAQAIEGGVSYTAESFEPIANWGADPAVVVVKADSPYETVGELIAYAKENPGKVTVSGAGLYVGHHIAALQIEKATGAKIVYIPTAGGGAAAMKAVMSGTVVAGINNLSDAYRAAKAGSVKVLAVADLERNEEFLPDVPTLEESGIDVDDASVNFRGLMAPKGTPEEILELLADKASVMFADEKVAEKMSSGGSPVRIMDRAEVKEMWALREKTLQELLASLK